MRKAIELIEAKMRPRAGCTYTAKQLKIVFGYSQSTYILDTQLVNYIERVPTNGRCELWRIKMDI